MWFAIASAIASLVGNTVSTVQNIRENKKQANEVAAQYQAKANARAREAKELMQRQKTSFLKGGVFFDTGSANAVINETYDTYKQDIADMNLDSNISQGRLIRAGKTAFWNYLANPMGGSGMDSLGKIFQDSGTTKNPASTTGKTGTKLSGGIKGDDITFA